VNNTSSIKGKIIKSRTGYIVKTAANSALVEGRPVVIYNKTDERITDINSGRSIGKYEKILGTGKVMSATAEGITIEVAKYKASPNYSLQPVRLKQNKVVASHSRLLRRKGKRRLITQSSSKECLVKVIG
jgi:hypothetical protein